MVHPEPGSFRDLMAQGGFMRLWVARLAGTTANQMLMVAVGWQMYELTGSAWDLGLIGLYQFTPALLLTLWAGHVADRHHRGRIVAVCLTVQCVAALVLADAARGHWASRAGRSRALRFAAQIPKAALAIPCPVAYCRLSAANSATSPGFNADLLVCDSL